jgi:hypothetical protein
VFRGLLQAGQIRAVTGGQLELISADPRVMHGQAVIAGTRVPVSVILDCLAAGMTAGQITAEYPGGHRRGCRCGGVGAGGIASDSAVAVKFKPGGNLPGSAAGILAGAGHDAGTVRGEGLTGAAGPDVVSAATGAGRILVWLDVGLGDIRAYPPGSHAGIVVLRVPDQSAATVTKTVSDLASLTELASLAGPVAVLQRGLLRIRHP